MNKIIVLLVTLLSVGCSAAEETDSIGNEPGVGGTAGAGGSVQPLCENQCPAGPKGDTGPAGPQGEKGEKGDANGIVGPMGPEGPVGADGAVGPAGPAGPQGSVGPQGPMGFVGAQGQTGLTGAPGPVGATGSVGPKGDKGDTGATGATGSVGPVGPKGDTGATGAPGTPGGIAKSKLYVVTQATTLYANQAQTEYAICYSVNDVLITGGCEQSNLNGTLLGSKPSQVESTVLASRWGCRWVGGSANNTVTTTVVCAVP